MAASRGYGVEQLGRIDDAIDPVRARSIRTSAGRYLADWDDTATPHATWTGMHSMTPDGLPCIGWLRPYDDVTVASDRSCPPGSTAAVRRREERTPEFVKRCAEVCRISTPLVDGALGTTDHHGTRTVRVLGLGGTMAIRFYGRDPDTDGGHCASVSVDENGDFLFVASA